jgi:uncharacterized protein with ACT and thioredoxin-like domain
VVYHAVSVSAEKRSSVVYHAVSVIAEKRSSVVYHAVSVSAEKRSSVVYHAVSVSAEKLSWNRGIMSERQNTAFCAFDPKIPGISALDIHE